MAKPFYQTTPLNDFELAEKIASANALGDKIMLYMQNKAPQEFNAWTLQEHFHKYPITSVRRALHYLEEKNHIIHVGWERAGEFNEKVGKYRASLPSEVKTDHDDDGLIPEGLGIKQIGKQVLKKWLAENKIPFTGKRPKKFRQKDLNKVIMSEIFNNVEPKIK